MKQSTKQALKIIGEFAILSLNVTGMIQCGVNATLAPTIIRRVGNTALSTMAFINCIKICDNMNDSLQKLEEIVREENQKKRI